MESRIIWVDYAKAIGIFLVVFAHTPLLTTAQNYVYVFHMPLFFFLSGFLFSFDRHPDFLTFVKKRTLQLLIPYLFFSVVTYLFWVFLGRNFGDDAGLDIPYYQPLIGILYANGLPDWMIHCIPLWFLPCLFLVEVMYFLLFKNIKHKSAMVLLIMLLTYFFVQLDIPRMPWSLNTAIVVLSIYGMGNVSKEWIRKILDQDLIFKIMILVLAAISVFFVAELNGRINMHIHYYGNYFLFLTGAVVGVTGVIIICDILSLSFKRNFWIEFFSKNTLIVLGFHLIAGSILKGVTVFGFGRPLEIYHNKFWINAGFTLVTFLVLIPVTYFINRVFPALVGNKNIKATNQNVPN